MFRPEPPQGFSKSQSQVIIGRPPIPLFGAPQGIGAAPTEDLLVAKFPTVPQIEDTIVFSGIDLDVSPEDMSLRGLTISSDGLRLFMIGSQNNKIFQYNLTTANDLSTATFSGIALDILSEDVAPEGLTISSDGLRLFMCGGVNLKIFQYNLTTANDLSTATFSGIALDVSPEDETIRGLTVSSNGSRLFMIGSQNNKIFQYNLTTANDLSTATFSGISLDISPEDTALRGLTVSSNGSKLFMNGDVNQKIFQYNLTTANDLSTATFSGIALDVSPEDGAAEGLTISSDGSKLFMGGNQSNKLFQYDIITVDAFQFQKFYTIKNNQVPSLQTNTPLAIIDTVGAGVIQEASGFDIKVFDEQTLLEIPYERQFVDVATGEFINHFKLGEVQDLNFVQIIFGNPTATDISTTILDSEYDLMYRMNQTAFGANSTIDSSPNNRDGTPNGDISSITGQVGLALEGDGVSGSRITTGSQVALDSTEFTISFWCFPNALAGGDHFCGTFVVFGTDQGWLVRVTGDPIKLQFTPNGNAGSNMTFTNTLVVTGVWQKFSLVLKNGVITVYKNGDPIESLPLSAPITTGSDFAVFGLPATGFEIDSRMDEYSIQNVATTADEIKTQFNNEFDNDAFWSKTPLLEIGKSNFLVDDQGNRFKAVQS